MKTRKAQVNMKGERVVEEVVESGLGMRGKHLELVGMWRTFYLHIHSVKQRLLSIHLLGGQPPSDRL
jgi:hypothetical protein